MLTILLGLIGLGLVVLVHELGHFVLARAMHVEVEAFSIGWGPRIVGFKRGGTEWKISAFPIGGYCKMKGEDSFRKALETKSESLPREDGSFYGAAPWRRILISLAGPVSNVIFAALVFIVIAAVGYTVHVSPNRIALASEYKLDSATAGQRFPADAAGLKTGDVIIEANGRPIHDYSAIQEVIALSAGKPVSLVVERAGRRVDLTVTPVMDKDTGAGRIGVFSWIDPVVSKVIPGSPAAIAGIQPGDVIVSINGKPVRHVVEALALLASHPERAVFGIKRNDAIFQTTLVLNWKETGQSTLGGMNFALPLKTIRASSIGGAIVKGLGETWKTFDLSIQGLGMLFRGVNVLKAVSGPARIVDLVGKSATEGLEKSGSGGLALPFNILAFLSIGLFIMNLLPIPALDGGQIVMFVVESFRRRPLRPTTIYRYQFVGAAFILAIFVFATVGDVLFFAAR
ncbi:MAG: RIP metalloprotease RseP [Treponema sp.]|nr:RIP metalloprotease RseP [Treponema sp.]